MLAGFFVAGIAGSLGFVAFLFALWPAEQMPWPFRVVLLCAAGLMAAIVIFGLWISLGGERIEIDLENSQLSIARGRWYVWEREEHSLTQFKRLRCYRRISQMVGEQDSSADYPVLLKAPGVDVELAAFGRYQESRQLAESLSKWLHLDFEDATERETSVRRPDEMDLSLAERLKLAGKSPALRWPKTTRLQRSNWGESVILHLPGLTRGQLLEGIIGLLFLLVIYGGSLGGIIYTTWQSLGSELTGSVWGLMLSGLAAVPVLWLLLFGLGLLTLREEVWVSPGGVQRLWRFPVGQWASKLSSADIEEIIDDGNDVILRSDRRRLRLGFMLPKPERKLLRRAVLHYLTASNPVN